MASASGTNWSLMVSSKHSARENWLPNRWLMTDSAMDVLFAGQYRRAPIL